jgi:hypothetical protein
MRMLGHTLRGVGRNVARGNIAKAGRGLVKGVGKSVGQKGGWQAAASVAAPVAVAGGYGASKLSSARLEVLLEAAREKRAELEKQAFTAGIATGLAKGLGRGAGGVLGLGGKAVSGTLGTAGKVIRKYPKVSIPVIAGGTAAAMEIPQAIRRSRYALSPRGVATRRASGFNLAKTPKEVAGMNQVTWNPKVSRSGSYDLQRHGASSFF